MILKRVAAAFLSAILCTALWSTPTEAARKFAGGAGPDCLVGATTIDLSAYTKLSFSYWLWVDTFGNGGEVSWQVWESGVSDLHFTPNASGVGGLDSVYYTRTNQSQATYTRPSGGAWHHYVHTVDLSQATQIWVKVYVDAVDQTLTNPLNLTGPQTVFDNLYTAYFMCYRNTSLWLAGRMAEFAMWPGMLMGQADVTTLNAGTKLPDDASLVAGAAAYYWKICGATSPELATLGGVNLTVNGTTDTPHPSAVARSCSGRLVGDARP